MRLIAPPASSPAVRNVMRANRAANTAPEIDLRRTLREGGYPGYRLNWRGVPGRPDIAYVGRRVAIFVHGCFWHRCQICALPLPRSNRAFWVAKFRRNRARDRRKRLELEMRRWMVFEVYECWLRDHPATVPTGILRALRREDSRQ